MKYRTLSKEKLLETAEGLAHRIAERFPKSGLSEVAAELTQVTREALARAEAIRRPNVLLRAGLAGLVVLAALGLWWLFPTAGEQATLLGKAYHLLDAAKGGAVYLGAFALFFVTLEVRLKRRKALRAVHELRALAHVIDMHQLTKDPDRLGAPDGPQLPSGRPMNAEQVGQYLHYCTELLALVSKVGQLYVQGFPDATALAAVDQFEGLATGLSQKIWQKIMILDRLRDAGGVGTPAADEPHRAGTAEAGV
jgi:hypothetical protein